MIKGGDKCHLKHLVAEIWKRWKMIVHLPTSRPHSLNARRFPSRQTNPWEFPYAPPVRLHLPHYARSTAGQSHALRARVGLWIIGSAKWAGPGMIGDDESHFTLYLIYFYFCKQKKKEKENIFFKKKKTNWCGFGSSVESVVVWRTVASLTW